MSACYTTQHGAPIARIRITRAAAYDITVKNNVHIACAREKLTSHPTGKIWTMCKNAVLVGGTRKLVPQRERERERERREKKTEICNMSCVHAARSIMRMMFNEKNDGICKEWKGQELSIKF